MNYESYRSLIDRIQFYFAEPHSQINRFYEGFYDDMGTLITQDTEFPVMCAVLQETLFPNVATAEFRIRFYFVDLLRNDQDNQRDVLSDQLRTARDLVNWLRKDFEGGASEMQLLNNAVVYPFRSIFMDYTAGVYVDLEIEVNMEESECVIPWDGYVEPAFTYPGYNDNNNQ